MNKFLLSNQHYEIELSEDRDGNFYILDNASMAGQCDCDCSSDCACAGASNIIPNRIHIEFTNRKKEMERIIKTKNDIVLDAPAGFGKTFLLDKISEEMSPLGWKIVRLSLVGPDREPIVRKKLAWQILQALDPLWARKFNRCEHIRYHQGLYCVRQDHFAL